MMRVVGEALPSAVFAIVLFNMNGHRVWQGKRHQQSTRRRRAAAGVDGARTGSPEDLGAHIIASKPCIGATPFQVSGATARSVPILVASLPEQDRRAARSTTAGL
jgi:hypothetical protein